MLNTLLSQALPGSPSASSVVGETTLQQSTDTMSTPEGGLFQGQGFGQWLQAKLMPQQALPVSTITQELASEMPTSQGATLLSLPIAQPLEQGNKPTLTNVLGVFANSLQQAPEPVQTAVQTPVPQLPITTPALLVEGSPLSKTATPDNVSIEDNDATPLTEDTTLNKGLLTQAFQAPPESTLVPLQHYFAAALNVSPLPSAPAPTALPISTDSPAILPPTVTLTPQMLPANALTSNTAAELNISHLPSAPAPTALPISTDSPGILPPEVTLTPQMLPATVPSPVSKLELTADQRQALNASWITSLQVVTTTTQAMPQATPQAPTDLQQRASSTLPIEVNTPERSPLQQAPQATALPPLLALSATPQTILTGQSDKHPIVGESAFNDSTSIAQPFPSLNMPPQPLSNATPNTTGGDGQAHTGAGSSSGHGQTPGNTLDNTVTERFSEESRVITPDAAALGLTPQTNANMIPAPPVATQLSDAIAGLQSTGATSASSEATNPGLQGAQKTLTLDLKPEALGSVKIQMVSQGDTLVSTRVIVNTPEAQQALQESFNDIKVQLAKQGVTLNSLEVVLQPASVGTGLSAVEAMVQANTADSDTQQQSRDAQQGHWQNNGGDTPFGQSTAQNNASGFSQGNAGQAAQLFQQFAQEQGRRNNSSDIPPAAASPLQTPPERIAAPVASQQDSGRVSVLV